MFKNTFKKKKIIRKPNWFLCVIPFIVLLELVAYIVYQLSAYSFVESVYFTSDNEYINTYINDIAQFGFDGFTEEELAYIKGTMAIKSVANDFPAIITIDGEEVFNTSHAMCALVYDERTELTPSQKIFIIHWDPETDVNVKKLYDYQQDLTLNHGYGYEVDDFYVDFETHTLYIGKVSVTELSGMMLTYADFPDFIGTTEKVVEVVDLTPDDKSLLEGLIHVDNTNFDGDYHLGIFRISGSAEGGMTDDIPEYMIGQTRHSVYSVYNNSFNENMRHRLYRFYATLLGVAALVIALIFGTIKFFMNRSTYNIFEYRRKTTNAMAHDLKTPLAIASLSVDNLKENLGTDEARVEYHANEIEDSINYMDQLICNILDFSNSETIGRSLSKSSFYVGPELEIHKQEISKVLSSRDLKLEITGAATRVTDKQIWNQALFNLVDNAAKYATSGSTITVALSEKEISITNDVEKDIPNVHRLVEPFVKGDDNRGENSGSGLGLSIADNNFRALGYRLKLSCENKKFTAVIK